MNNNIFIPKQINIGFQERNDTYTNKLAYVIYFDEKGKLRKELSWEGWRDKNIPNKIFDNIPTEGFVLNKKVGDYCSDWNHRQAYIRVYDPRNFEFEITVENLLYILENCSSIKGKGLEGQFIYGWDGKDLILLPIDSPDYKEIKEYTDIILENKTIKAKDLIIGVTYKTKQNEEWIYMGKYDYYDYNGVKKQGKYFWFAHKKQYSWENKPTYYFKQIKTLSNDKLISVIDENFCENYAEIFDKMEQEYYYSPIDDDKEEFKYYTFEEFKNRQEKTIYDVRYYVNNSKENRIIVDNRYLPKIIVHEEKLITKSSHWNDNTYTEWSEVGFLKEEFDSLEELYNKYKPQYINEYLQNGKFHYKREA